MSSRGNQRIVRSFVNLIMLIVTYLVHFTVHAIKVNGPMLMEKIKKTAMIAAKDEGYA